MTLPRYLKFAAVLALVFVVFSLVPIAPVPWLALAVAVLCAGILIP